MLIYLSKFLSLANDGQKIVCFFKYFFKFYSDLANLSVLVGRALLHRRQNFIDRGILIENVNIEMNLIENTFMEKNYIENVFIDMYFIEHVFYRT